MSLDVELAAQAGRRVGELKERVVRSLVPVGEIPEVWLKSRCCRFVSHVAVPDIEYLEIDGKWIGKFVFSVQGDGSSVRFNYRWEPI